MKFLRFALLCATFSLVGCAALSTSVSKKNLDVQTRISDTIYLEPVSPAQKVIWLRVRNTSDKQDFELDAPVRQALLAKGYRLTDDPEQAHYWLDAVVKSVNKTDQTAGDAAATGFGGAVVGGALGAGVSNEGDQLKGGVLGALLIGGLSMLVNSSVKDVTYMAVVDMQITEKARAGVVVRSDTEHKLAQGSSGSTRQIASQAGDSLKYQTRVVSTANKVNLKYEEAAPKLREGLVRSVAGLF